MRRRLEAWAAGLVSVLLRVLPRSAALGLGGSLGRVLATLDRRHVGIARDNLRRAFPAWEPARLETTARSVYVHFGRILFDILWLERRSPGEMLRVVEVEGGRHVEAAIAEKRGILYCTGHIGNWEVHAAAHALVFGPISVVVRPLDNSALDARLRDFRTRTGNAVIHKRRALAEIMRALRGAQGVAILLDQNVQFKDGIFVDFFGRPAATTTVAAALAAKTGCALIPVHSTLMPNGRYRLRYEPPLSWTPSGARDADITHLTQELARRTEEWIRQNPEQWLWMHRRWKTRPTDETVEGQAAAQEAR